MVTLSSNGHQLHRSLKISTVCPLIASPSRASQQVVQQNGLCRILHHPCFTILSKKSFSSFVLSMPKISLELVILACVFSCLYDPVQNWKGSKGNIQAFLVCEFSAYLAIIWNKWKRKYLKQPQNVWHRLLTKVHLDSNEAWPDWEKSKRQCSNRGVVGCIKATHRPGTILTQKYLWPIIYLTNISHKT